MTITPVEIIALLIAVFMLLKVVIFSMSKKSFLGLYDHMFSRNICVVVYAVLAGIVLYFLLQELTIVQIVASVAFFSLIGAIGVMIHGKESRDVVKKTLKKKVSGIGFLLMMVMIVIACWVVYEVLLSAGWI